MPLAGIAVTDSIDRPIQSSQVLEVLERWKAT